MSEHLQRGRKITHKNSDFSSLMNRAVAKTFIQPFPCFVPRVPYAGASAVNRPRLFVNIEKRV